MRHSIDMDPKEIRVEMARAGVSQAGLARDLGVSPTMINRTIDGLSVSHEVRNGIAKAVEIPVERIWPSTYIYHGGPRRPGRPFGSTMNSKGA